MTKKEDNLMEFEQKWIFVDKIALNFHLDMVTCLAFLGGKGKLTWLHF